MGNCGTFTRSYISGTKEYEAREKKNLTNALKMQVENAEKELEENEKRIANLAIKARTADTGQKIDLLEFEARQIAANRPRLMQQVRAAIAHKEEVLIHGALKGLARDRYRTTLILRQQGKATQEEITALEKSRGVVEDGIEDLKEANSILSPEPVTMDPVVAAPSPGTGARPVMLDDMVQILPDFDDQVFREARAALGTAKARQLATELAAMPDPPSKLPVESKSKKKTKKKRKAPSPSSSGILDYEDDDD